jgi:ATP-binding cassette subfamily B protein
MSKTSAKESSKREPRNLSAKLRDAAALAHYWPRTFRLIWAAAPRYTLAWGGLLIVLGVLPAASAYLTKLLVDSLVAAIGAGGTWEYARPALVLLIITAAIMLLTELLQSLSEWIRAAQSELIQDHIKNLVHQQSVQVDLAFYESSDYHDHLDRARNEASGRPLALLESTGSLLQNGITLLAMAVVLIPYSPLLPLILLVSTLPAFFVVLRFDRRYHDWWKRTTADRRWIQYYDLMLTHSMAAAELRLFGLGSHFQSEYQDRRRRLREERLAQLKKQGFARLGAGIVALIISGATMVWMVWRALRGMGTLGDLALFYQAFNKGQGLMRALLGNVGQIYTNTLFLSAFYDFLELKRNIDDPPNPIPAPSELKEGINFRNITFRYPGSDRPALEDFSLFIPSGKIVAIVGANGAGKTTLLKLLCRFYDPDAGRVELDGVDIREFPVEDLWRRIAMLFQQPINYHTTVGHSIAMGDLAAAPQPEEIEEAARNAGAHEIIARLPDGYKTMLGKWFVAGVELSGGEWQRINMARAYVRRAPIILLDEPTSFMDSWAEADWFERFRGLADGRTAILITHRFTIAMRADIIHVMHEGKIVESGSHQQLLAADGLYAQSWAAQIRASSGAGAENQVDSRQPYENLTL